MGNQKDWSPERRRHSREREEDVTWSSLSNDDDEAEFETYHPAPPNYFTLEMMELDVARIDKGYQLPPPFEKELPPQKTQLSSQPAPKQSPQKTDHKSSQQQSSKKGFWSRLWNRGNRSASPQKTNSSAVTDFQQRLRNRANNKLDENKQQVFQLSAAYNANDPDSKPLFNELRAVVTQDARLSAKQNELQQKINNYQSLSAERAMGVSVPLRENLAQLTAQLAQIKQVRATLLANYPVSGLIEAHQVGDDVSDAQIEDILTNRFAGINRDIDVAKEKMALLKSNDKYFIIKI